LSASASSLQIKQTVPSKIEMMNQVIAPLARLTLS
jgi:hypothetical protein